MKGIIAILGILGLILVAVFSLTKPQTRPTPDVIVPTVTNTETDGGEFDFTENLIILREGGFMPDTLTIKTGEKVVWRNESGENATVDSSEHPTHLDYPPLNLGSFGDGETLELTFDEAGTYNFHNHFDDSQNGTIIVEP